jgi:hypothetical protein
MPSVPDRKCFTGSKFNDRSENDQITITTGPSGPVVLFPRPDHVAAVYVPPGGLGCGVVVESRCTRAPLGQTASKSRDKGFVIRHSSFVIRHSSFVIRHSSFAIRHSPFVIRHSSFAICQKSVSL